MPSWAPTATHLHLHTRTSPAQSALDQDQEQEQEQDQDLCSMTTPSSGHPRSPRGWEHLPQKTLVPGVVHIGQLAASAASPLLFASASPQSTLGLVAFTSMQGASRRIRSQRAQSSAYLYATGPCMSARGFLGLPAGAVARGHTDVTTFLE